MNKITFAAVALLTASSAMATNINLVTNGGFEDTWVTAAWPYAQVYDLAGWTSTNGAAFEIQMASNFQNKIPDFATSYDGSAHYLELNSNELGGIAQTLQTIAGQSYTLSFGYANRTGAGAASSVDIYVGGEKIDSKSTALTSWTTYTETFTATGNSTQLKFVSTGPTSNPTYGSYLDGVSVTAVSGASAVSAVPEPETYALLLAGLGLMATIARRRKSTTA